MFSFVPSEVRKMMYTALLTSRRRRQTSIPSIPGIIQSSTTREGASVERMTVIAAWPSVVTTVSYPQDCNRLTRTSQETGSSSATKIRGAVVGAADKILPEPGITALFDGSFGGSVFMT